MTEKIERGQKIERLYVDDLIVPEGRRQLNQERVEQIAASIKLLGQQTPITVWSPDNENIYLIAGRHRFEAMKLLGGTRIDGIVVEMDERERRMWEISENLHRSELTALERSELQDEWLALSAEQELQSAQVAPIESKRSDRRGHRSEGGLRAATRELGIERTEAQRAEKIAGLTPEAKAAAKQLGLDDNQSALLEAAKAKNAVGQVAKLRERAERKVQQRSPRQSAIPVSQAAPLATVCEGLDIVFRAIEGVDASDPTPTIEQSADQKDALRMIDQTIRLLSQRSAEVLALPRHVRLGRAMQVLDALGIGTNDLVPPGRR